MNPETKTPAACSDPRSSDRTGT